MAGQLKYYFDKTLKAIRSFSISDSWRKKVFYLKHDFPGELLEDKKGVHLTHIDLYILSNTHHFILDQY